MNLTFVYKCPICKRESDVEVEFEHMWLGVICGYCFRERKGIVCMDMQGLKV